MRMIAREGGDDPRPPQPPTQSPNAPVEEPPDSPQTEPDAPVREPGPEEPKKWEKQLLIELFPVNDLNSLCLIRVGQSTHLIVSARTRFPFLFQ
jgi:hypothetical protein